APQRHLPQPVVNVRVRTHASPDHRLPELARCRVRLWKRTGADLGEIRKDARSVEQEDRRAEREDRHAFPTDPEAGTTDLQGAAWRDNWRNTFAFTNSK